MKLNDKQHITKQGIVKKNPKNPYNQLCVSQGIQLDEFTKHKFEEYMKSEGFRIKVVDIVKTNPDKDEEGRNISDTGGRTDVFFYIHSDDISKFSVQRFQWAVTPRWWEDVLENGGAYLYPQSILDKYKKEW